MSNVKCQISNVRSGCKQARHQIPNKISHDWKLDIGNLTLDIPASQAGFTIPELAVTLAVFSILASWVFVSAYQSQQQANVHAAVNTLITDIRHQQVKTMTGDTQNTGTITNYGIYFQSGKYTLFHGTAYSSSDPTNFDVTLSSNLQFINDTFTNSTLLFDKGSGEMLNYASNANSITIKDTATQESKTITVNRYGVVTGVN